MTGMHRIFLLLFVLGACRTDEEASALTQGIYDNGHDPVDRCIAACYFCFTDQEDFLVDCANTICLGTLTIRMPMNIDKACTILKYRLLKWAKTPGMGIPLDEPPASNI
ncbi:unnamed protein product [Calicophoron daubneyi]|uniref:Uncharacterized protein n=1 Tax=Calicophoron daubneyi TaxID=300641 RepID=A0AAV2TYV8_CALDB